jgi:hypothetical protein
MFCMVSRAKSGGGAHTLSLFAAVLPEEKGSKHCQSVAQGSPSDVEFYLILFAILDCWTSINQTVKIHVFGVLAAVWSLLIVFCTYGGYSIITK